MSIELLQALTALLGFLCFITALINAIIFYRKFYKNLAEKIDGGVYDYGFLFSANRFMLWGQYCLFPEKGKNRELSAILSNISETEKYRLKLHFIIVLTGCTLMIISGLLAS
ncbi:hypothetical protein M3P05_16530 [Sansalvadorimonas sp. 2012CJ34-2]|uniref:Uncharacterized protein n=1 Tax=Parendozoicomonas callyspongiae TaxID=2942213 RepID=A0ABT0PJL3_9GAMM|nr:hypothetical protein [Sansalvadorimonas sp. 2012CJ34-2]MCL6271523.1 hypothetical protein [Sansalvadorimonas sp. 2012CJ34-2]